MKHATIEDAPKCLNTNDKAMWVLGYNESIDATIKLLTQGANVEPEAMRHSFDGYGWMYIDNGSGSSWQDRDYPHKEFLVTIDQLTAAIAAARVQAIQDCKDAINELSYDASRGDCASAIRALSGDKT